MNRTIKLYFTIVTVLMVTDACLTRSAQAQVLGSAAGYNVFVLTNDFDSSDAGGAVAVGGNATFSGYSIGDNLPVGSAPNLVVGGTLTSTYGTVNGSVYANTMDVSDPTVNGNLDANTINLNAYGTVTGTVTYAKAYTNPAASGNPVSGATPTTVDGSVKKGTYTSPINFTTATNTLDADSSTWSNLLSNGIVSEDGTGKVTMTGASKTLNVFNMTAVQLNGNTFVINAPAGSTVLINIPGTNDTWQGNLTLSGGISANDVMYNFVDAKSLNLDGIDVQGSLLAPYAAVIGSGDVYGNFIVNSLGASSGPTSYEEANYNDPASVNDDNVNLVGDMFAGVLPNGGQISIVPEPSSMLTILYGVLVAMTLMLSRRKNPFRQF